MQRQILIFNQYKIKMIEKKLNLYSVEKVPFAGGKETSWKYIFICPPPYAKPQDKWLVAWGKDGIYADMANEKIADYNEITAKAFPFKAKEFGGVVTEKLVEDPAYVSIL